MKAGRPALESTSILMTEAYRLTVLPVSVAPAPTSMPRSATSPLLPSRAPRSPLFWSSAAAAPPDALPEYASDEFCMKVVEPTVRLSARAAVSVVPLSTSIVASSLSQAWL